LDVTTKIPKLIEHGDLTMNFTTNNGNLGISMGSMENGDFTTGKSGKSTPLGISQLAMLDIGGLPKGNHQSCEYTLNISWESIWNITSWW
jgi:hypothetical protein